MNNNNSMESKLDALYKEFILQIISVIPVDWSEIYVQGSVSKGKESWGANFYFKEKSSQKFINGNNIPQIYNVSSSNYRNFLRKLNSLLLEIYDCFIEFGHEPWYEFTMHIKDSGAFNIDFSYEYVELGQLMDIHRQLLWAYKTFSYIPEDETAKKALMDMISSDNS